MRVATFAMIAALILTTSARASLVKPQQVAPEDAYSYLSIADEHEPGEWIVIVGNVNDGQTWIRGASIYVSHADWTGQYAPDKTGEPRLRGAIRSNYHGGYDFDTVRPGHPDRRTPASINCVITAPGFKERLIDFYFDDDPLLTPELRAAAANPPEDGQRQVVILPLHRDGRGVFHAEFDITLTRISSATTLTRKDP